VAERAGATTGDLLPGGTAHAEDGMSRIEWTDETWNPVSGCTKVSAGCKFCYAETVANRFWAKQYPAVARMNGTPVSPRTFTDVWTHPDRLAQPLGWRKPRRVFVNSMSDLFHPDVPDDFIDQVFAVMALCPQHTFQVLTKRPERMREYVSGLGASPGDRIGDACFDLEMRPEDSDCLVANIINGFAWWRDMPERGVPLDGSHPLWPLPNTWLGVSVENQATADVRIPFLLQTPAALRFVSVEPLLAPVNLAKIPAPNQCHQDALSGRNLWNGRPMERLDWLIVGGESGPKARPCDVEWIRSIVQQCKAAGVPCFVKQLGARPYDGATIEPTGEFRTSPETGHRQMGATVRTLGLRSHKGADPSEWPEDLRVREWPA